MKTSCLIILISLQISATAQSWQWTRSGGGTGACDLGGPPCFESDFVKQMITDDNGNTYFIASGTSSAMDSLQVGDKNVFMNAAQDILYGKINCEGKTVWLKIMGSGAGGTRSDADKIFCMSLDKKGNLYLFGQYYTSNGYPFKIDKDTFIPRNAPWVGPLAGVGGFALKIDTNGKFLKLNVFGPDEGFPFLKTVFDNDGYLWAIMYGLKKYLPTDSFPLSCMYLAKIDPDTYRPIKYFQITPKNKYYYSSGLSNFVIDKHKNFYLCNSAIADYIYVKDTFFYNTSAISKFDSTGANKWNLVAHDKPNTPAPEYAYINDIKFDENDDYYISYFGMDGLVNGDSVNIQYKWSGLNYGRGVIKYNGKTNKMIWNKMVSETQQGDTEGYSLVLLKNGTAAISTIYGTLKCDTTTVVSKLQRDMALILIDSTGKLLKIEPVYAQTNNGTMERLTTDAKGNIYAYGMTFGDSYFGKDTLKYIGGSTDFYLAKYGQANCSCPLLKSTCIITDSSITRSLTMNFSGTGADSVVYYWGDGTKSSGLNPSHTYAKDTTYKIMVVAYNSCWKTDTFFMNKTFKSNSIIDLFSDNNVSIYPNPVLQYLTIKFKNKNANDLQVIIQNAIGKVVYSGIYPNDAVEQHINLEHFSTGIYMVELRENNQVKYQGKVVK